MAEAYYLLGLAVLILCATSFSIGLRLNQLTKRVERLERRDTA
jgi:hypothetical protein